MTAHRVPQGSAVAPWTVFDSVVTFADPWLRVRSDSCVTTGGEVIRPYHVIEYPDWVTIVPLTRTGLRLLLVREYRHGVGRVLSGLPGGAVDPGDGGDRSEAAAAAAARELREETGYGGGRLEALGTLHPNPSNQTNTAHCFIASGLAQEGPPRPGGAGEVQDVQEVDFASVLDELREGRIVMHAVHSAAIWTAAARIAADRSGRFGPLTMRLRRAFAGERQPRHGGTVGSPVTVSTVGG